ncbi:MAG: XTP/dITP diphosphatase [Verrucomicrobiae bacterium]|nr:XTP/dITP diphosphatase [Verrucomicrobiae bacterium]
MATPQVLILATRNAKKAKELQQLLASQRWEVKTLDEFSSLPEVAEDGKTFEANAVKKAVTISQYVPHYVVADDSGLEVEALQGAPGIYSARYAAEGGENASDQANCEKLLREMDSISDRQAQFRCVLAVAYRGKLSTTTEGVCRGKIITESRGNLGFGYDPLFVPDGYEKTFAELSGEIKNQISHRAVAIKQLKKWLETTILINEKN